jgi:hypothetical protein
VVFDDSTVRTELDLNDRVRWMAPELHRPNDVGLEMLGLEIFKFARTFAIDVYAFACVCVEVGLLCEIQ